MPNSGITSTTVDRLAIGPALVYRGSTVIGTLGASATAEEVTEWRQPRIAGMAIPIEGLDRKTTTTLRITGEFLEHDSTESAKWLNGGTITSGGGVFNVIGPDTGVLFGSSNYDDDIRFVFMLGNGDEFRAVMSSGIVTGYPFAGQDPGEGASTVTWEARTTYANPDDAPYTYVFVESGTAPPSSDVHIALIDDLGGNSAVAGIYVTTDGETGLAADSVITSAGVVDEWQDYRHPTLYAPAIFTGTAKPAWDAVDFEITSDGVDDGGDTVAFSGFDLSGAKAIVLVASYASGNYALTLNSGAAIARFMAIETVTAGVWNHQAQSPFPTISSGVTADATRRVVIIAKDNNVAMDAVVPNHTAGSGVMGAPTGAGDNFLSMFRATSSATQYAGLTVKAVLVLNFRPDATQRGIIRDWAILNLGAVAAS